MSDQTPVFYELCRAAAVKTRGPCGLDRGSREDETKSRTADAYMNEALLIYKHILSLQAYLVTIRPAYLSVSTQNYNYDTPKAPSSSSTLTNTQRDEIDYESRLILQRCTTRVRRLEEIEAKRAATASSHAIHSLSDAISRILNDKQQKQADGKNMSLGIHRRGVTQLLNMLLRDVSNAQAEMQEVRLQREIEKTKSRLNASAALNDIYASTANNSNRTITMDELLHGTASSDAPAEQLPAALVQELEQENQALLAEFQETQQQAEQAERSMYEIATLQGELAAHLTQQAEITDRLYEEAVESKGHVEGANEQLKSARRRNRIASKIVIFTSLFLAFFLLFVDYATS
ncbi:uncharacterized protein V1518DRAFT_396779 [Limtongia smithiae]|uniref:uncharacterized protein n=1 Tax=Limtongia smithiae TaxID=1125753 RepID=UPI0034CD87D9